MAELFPGLFFCDNLDRIISVSYTHLDVYKRQDLYKATREDQISYAVTYGEFMYQAGSWEYPRCVVFKIEKPYGQLTHMYTFIVTNMEDVYKRQDNNRPLPFLLPFSIVSCPS